MVYDDIMQRLRSLLPLQRGQQTDTVFRGFGRQVMSQHIGTGRHDIRQRDGLFRTASPVQFVRASEPRNGTRCPPS